MKPHSHLWDIFCQVVDNHGDLGVCWRLSQHLLRLGQKVRLYVDQPEALSWMAPHHQALKGLTLLPWPTQENSAQWRVEKDQTWNTPQCVVEAFGCEIPQVYLEHLSQNEQMRPNAGNTAPNWIWINLEYLSAEDYPDRQHRMASPVMHGAAKGKTKWFFYPGFTAQTGGLLKKFEDLDAKDHLQQRQEQDPLKWALNAQLKIFLFSYEPQALSPFLLDLSRRHNPTHLKVSVGRSAALVQRALESRDIKVNVVHHSNQVKQLHQLRIEFISAIDHLAFDALLTSSDLNFVRGEDSWVRAIWAQKPFIWQIYPQDDGVHLEKMNAFLRRFNAPPSLVNAHRIWNGFEHAALPSLQAELLNEWRVWSLALANELTKMPDLAEQLCDFLALKLQETSA